MQGQLARLGARCKPGLECLRFSITGEEAPTRPQTDDVLRTLGLKTKQERKRRRKSDQQQLEAEGDEEEEEVEEEEENLVGSGRGVGGAPCSRGTRGGTDGKEGEGEGKRGAKQAQRAQQAEHAAAGDDAGVAERGASDGGGFRMHLSYSCVAQMRMPKKTMTVAACDARGDRSNIHNYQVALPALLFS